MPEAHALTPGSTHVFVEADFRIERQPGEEGQAPRERLLVQQREWEAGPGLINAD